MLFVIDDLHWADPATLLMLRYVLRRVPGLVVLATSRDAADGGGQLSELAVDLRRDGAFERVLLSGLDVEATRELVAGRADPEIVHARTAGNPFFIEQLLRAGPDSPVPEGVKALINQRVAKLGAGEVLQFAAAAGAEFEFGVLTRATGAREPVVEALDAALSAGLVVDVTAGRFAFVHALAREAIYEDLSAMRRASLHLRLAETLDGPAAALAHHFFEARQLGSADEAVRWGLIAADEAAEALDWEQEIAQFEACLRVLDEFASPDDAARCRILLRLANRYVSLGGDYRAACRRAAQLAQPNGWADELAQAATGFARVSEYGIVDKEAVEMLELALAEIGDKDVLWRARLLSRLAETVVLDGRQRERCLALSYEGLQLARRLGDPVALIAALGAHSTALEGPDSMPERIELLREAQRIADALEHTVPWRYAVLAELGELHVVVGDVRQARTYADALEAEVVRTRFRGTYPALEVVRSRVTEAVIDGRLDEAEQLAREFAAGAEELGDPDRGHLKIAQLLPIRLEQNRSSELLAAVAERADSSPLPGPWQAVRCLLHVLAGRRDEAQAELSALVADDCAAIARMDQWLPALTLLADASAELRDRAAAATLLRLLSPYPDYVAVFLYGSGPLGPVSERLGRLALVLGDGNGAAAAFKRALAISEAMRAPFWSARAQAGLTRLKTT